NTPGITMLAHVRRSLEQADVDKVPRLRDALSARHMIRPYSDSCYSVFNGIVRRLRIADLADRMPKVQIVDRGSPHQIDDALPSFRGQMPCRDSCDKLVAFVAPRKRRLYARKDQRRQAEREADDLAGLLVRSHSALLSVKRHRYLEKQQMARNYSET